MSINTLLSLLKYILHNCITSKSIDATCSYQYLNKTIRLKTITRIKYFLFYFDMFWDWKIWLSKYCGVFSSCSWLFRSYKGVTIADARLQKMGLWPTLMTSEQKTLYRGIPAMLARCYSMDHPLSHLI